ncbi:hypothetical protein WNY51_10345 [Pseudocolwellia sp. AS88]|uniref:Agd3-related carbohydrate-binding protein n=1 Tax=Pseudocolwellia sp. AS88 TaxID=3063958 RepID=UPI0026F16343|nr:hypothetical protein [Pseudocolwellia sp. AS88]MDO7084234.1 hypothetical protein [Pseudocolwellia sp. AS88]
MNKVVINTLLISFLFFTQATIAKTVNLKLLVVASGTPEEDSGLDYIDDVLDEMGVPYEVLDASKQALTQETLVTDAVGNYSGVILTSTFLYYTGEDNYLNSALTLEEWKTLHNYERDFKVRESVISGDPISGEYFRQNYDLDYGMDASYTEAGNSFTATWQEAANDENLYSYVNTATPLNLTDYALATQASADPEGPTVLPLLTDTETGKIFISELTYADGRKVLLSTISNASYLLYSQIINYEFINYASQGVFIGSRQVHLSAHVDDLFAAVEVWDPETNTNHETNEYRNSAESIHNIVSAQTLFNEENENFPNFKLDLAFNGGYAQAPTTGNVSLISNKDTSISSSSRSKNTSAKSLINVRSSWFGHHRSLMSFDVSKADVIGKATLNLATVRTWLNYFYRGRGYVCLTTSNWDNAADWEKSNAQTSWLNQGGDYKAQDCVSYQENWGEITVDISPIITAWQASGSNELGLIFIAGNAATTQIYTKEASVALQPKLDIELSGSSDELTQAIIDTKDSFRFLNHTLTHRDMYTSSGATYDVALYEIAENLSMWQTLDLPGFETASRTLVTGNHSGLEDTESSNAESPEYAPFPDGLNTELMEAVENLGIEYFASDSSRVNQAVESYIPGTNVFMLPRYPTQVYYNVTTPEGLVDEYNYIYHDSYVERGIDPCSEPAAICTPKTYQEVLEYEANNTLLHMLTYKSWPHYFHITNFENYGNGETLQFDWLKAVAKKYNEYIKLPVKNLDFYTIGENTKNKLAAKSANVTGYWDKEAGTISITANDNVKVSVTGIQSGELYGDQKIISTNIDTFETILNVESIFTK